MFSIVAPVDGSSGGGGASVVFRYSYSSVDVIVNASFILAFMGLRDVDVDVGAGADRQDDEDEDEDVVAAVRVVIGGFFFVVDNKKRDLINQSSTMETCFAKFKVNKQNASRSSEVNSKLNHLSNSENQLKPCRNILNQRSSSL